MRSRRDQMRRSRAAVVSSARSSSPSASMALSPSAGVIAPRTTSFRNAFAASTRPCAAVMSMTRAGDVAYRTISASAPRAWRPSMTTSTSTDASTTTSSDSDVLVRPAFPDQLRHVDVDGSPVPADPLDELDALGLIEPEPTPQRLDRPPVLRGARRACGGSERCVEVRRDVSKIQRRHDPNASTCASSCASASSNSSLHRRETLPVPSIRPGGAR
ncbi:MAG: hypothetical protein QOG56_1939 [Solirubrobacteraceae bacterium]|nr:hypothetical protein [Solirubrobacteraceae bacterium]